MSRFKNLWRSSALASVRTIEWLLIATACAFLVLIIYAQKHQILIKSPQIIMSQIERPKKHPPRVVIEQIQSIKKDENIRRLESSLELERIKNLNLENQIQSMKYLMEEIFLASKLSLLAVNEEKINDSGYLNEHLDHTDLDTKLDVTVNNRKLDEKTGPVKLNWRPKPRPIQLPHRLKTSVSEEPIIQDKSSSDTTTSATPDTRVSTANQAITAEEKIEALSPELNKILTGFELQPTKRGFLVVIPGSDLFVRNSRDIAPNASDLLEPIANAANSDLSLDLQIIGHTDGLKSEEDSKKLSRRRAELVMRLLANELGIEADRMIAIGEGKGRPIASNATLDGRRTNRRIEIRFE